MWGGVAMSLYFDLVNSAPGIEKFWMLLKVFCIELRCGSP